MADQRVTFNTRVCDATTLTQGLAVDSSGRVTVATIATSVTPGGAAAHLGKAEDAVHTTGDTGVFMLAVRADTAAVTGGTDGDYSGLIVTAAGRLWTSAVIDTALPTGTNSIGNIGTITTSVTPGTAAANLGKAEDGAHTTGDVGIMALAVRNDANASLSGTDLDYTPIAVDAAGNLQVDVLTGGGGIVPTTPAWDITNLTTPVNLAAGAGGNADSADLPSKYLWQMVVSSSVSIKGILGTNDNGTITNKAVLFVPAGETYIYTPPAGGFMQAAAAGVGVQGWRLALTNLDTSETADVYVSYAYADNAF